MGIATDPAHEIASKIEVLNDLEGEVQVLMEAHERKRDLWFPSDLLGPAPDKGPDDFLQKLRDRPRGFPTASARRSRSTCSPKKGCPTSIASWPCTWETTVTGAGGTICGRPRKTVTARCSTTTPGTPGCSISGRSKRCSSSISEAGFHPEWDHDPYRVFAYTTVQERATQFSHGETGRIVGEYEPSLARGAGHVAKDEARHYAFYGSVFELILERDPNQALHSASFILPAIDMPGVTMPGFKELADVIRRSGIYGPRDYLRIVQEQIRYWKIESLEGLNELGRKAQEKISAFPPACGASPNTWRPGAARRRSASKWCSTANSRWNEPVRRPVLLFLLLLAGCGDEDARAGRGK